MLLGDKKRIFIDSLCGDALEISEKEKLVTSGKYKGQKTLVRLLKGEINAKTAAEEFH